jgi:hypothetical protein
LYLISPHIGPSCGYLSLRGFIKYILRIWPDSSRLSWVDIIPEAPS